MGEIANNGGYNKELKDPDTGWHVDQPKPGPECSYSKDAHGSNRMRLGEGWKFPTADVHINKTPHTFGGTRSGLLRNSGTPGAHRIGKR